MTFCEILLVGGQNHIRELIWGPAHQEIIIIFEKVAWRHRLDVRPRELRPDGHGKIICGLWKPAIQNPKVQEHSKSILLP